MWVHVCGCMCVGACVGGDMCVGACVWVHVLVGTCVGEDMCAYKRERAEWALKKRLSDLQITSSQQLTKALSSYQWLHLTDLQGKEVSC